TGRPVNPQPGVALACLQYVRSREGQLVRIAARTLGIGGVLLGEREIRLPTSPPPSATPTNSPTETPTRGSPTITGTVTDTPTFGPSNTPTETPMFPIRLAAIGGAARPGSMATIRFDLADEPGKVHELSFDILIDLPVFDVFQIANQCRTDPTLTTHHLTASLQLDPFVPPGKRRFRFVLVGAIGGAEMPLRPGPLINCELPVAATAPTGPSLIILDRVLPGDENGDPIPGVLPVNGVLTIDPNAPLPTETATRTATPTVTVTRTASATRTATSTPTATETPLPTASATATETATETPTPTATPTESATVTRPPSPLPTATDTPPPCAGDCDGDGEVAINELIRAVNISLGLARVSDCLAVHTGG